MKEKINARLLTNAHAAHAFYQDYFNEKDPMIRDSYKWLYETEASRANEDIRLYCLLMNYDIETSDEWVQELNKYIIFGGDYAGLH